MINVNDFSGRTDNEILENAIKNKQADGIVVIPPRKSNMDFERDYWLIDRAILLPENTTIIMQNAKIKLSDRCRDNFFRSANCGMGIEFPKSISNIHIRGEGLCILEGADRPRATGDGSKQLHAPCPHLPEDICKIANWLPADHNTPDRITFLDIHAHSYGTDANNPNESHYGDWRGIGILFANVQNFSVSGLKIVKPHGWALSFEACSYGKIERIQFDATMHREIDGMLMNMENQDGIDIRNGCHNIMITDITGQTGDDVVALTAIANSDYRPGGTVKNTHVMHNDWSKRERDIHDIIIQNVTAHSYLCHIVRLLPASSKIYNIVINNIIDDGTNNTVGTTLDLGNSGGWGEIVSDSLKNISISNVICNSKKAINIRNSGMTDSVITNIINKNPNCPTIIVDNKDTLKNVLTNNILP